MTKPNGSAWPSLVDPSVLEKLREELDDGDGLWAIFVRDFRQCLPHRTARLRLALTTGDLDGALNAVLSLKTSSQMVGAERLGELALNVERSIREASHGSDPALALPRLAVAYLKPINQCSRLTLHHLQAYLEQEAADI